MASRRWVTSEELSRLVELRSAGVPNREIAARMGRSLGWVEVRARKLGLERRRTGLRDWTLKEEDRMESMALDGRSAAEIGEALGRSVSAVWKRMSRLGVRKSRVNSLRWYDALWDGRPVAEVMARTGATSRHTVNSMRWKLRKAGFEMPSPARKGETTV